MKCNTALEIVTESIQWVLERNLEGLESIFEVLTPPDGPLRLLGRLGRARMRWKADVAYFLVNVMKCCENFGNVVKCCEML